MVVDQLKVDSLADDLSVLVLNRVLGKDMNIHEGLMALGNATSFAIGRTMPKEQFNKLFDESNPLALALINELKSNIELANEDGDKINITHVMLAFNTALDYVLSNMKE